MNSILIGHRHGTKEPVRIPRESFDCHWHILGGTGKGKTTLIHTMLHGLLLDPMQEPCVVIVDRMGNLSFELLLWMASDFCPNYVRDRLVYIEPSRENSVIGFNPLLYDTLAHGYYKVSRASEIVLKGWTSQNLEEMPRLGRWLFNSFWAAAQLGLTIADCVHLLMPGSPYHEQLLQCLVGPKEKAKEARARGVLRAARISRSYPYIRITTNWPAGRIRRLTKTCVFGRETSAICREAGPICGWSMIHSSTTWT